MILDVLNFVWPLLIGGAIGHFGMRWVSGAYRPAMRPGAPMTYQYEFQRDPNYATYVRSKGYGFHEVYTLDDRKVTIRAKDQMKELHLDDV